MENIQNYYENTQKPWGKLFYETIWDQLSFVQSMNVLDFGSGFGIMANFLAIHNHVIAIEPNEKMLQLSVQENKYEQIIGGLERLKEFPDNYFDFITCHNVLEYVDNKQDYVKEFSRVLKKSGVISLVKHNHSGRIMQRVIFENNLDLAIKEVQGYHTLSNNFGEIKYYDEDDITKWAEENHLKIDCSFGVRTFFGLVQNNEIKFDKAWQEKMLEIELEVSDIDEFRKIAFFHHVLLVK